MDYINIIAQEEITKVLEWPNLLVAGIVILSITILMIYSCISEAADQCKVFGWLLQVGIAGILAVLAVCIITSIFFQVPTGRYRYKATIDKDKITVSEYEKFIEEYSPTIKDGIYYWEDKAE